MNDVFLATGADYRAAVSSAGANALGEMATLSRINTLSTIHHAARGWIGACMSCAEILTALYFDVAHFDPDPHAADAIVLGKGHAAVMQYACLVGTGVLKAEDLLRYKHADGPQAHTDISTPGIVANTGSLGQALSKCCGLAMAAPNRHVFAVLGDGELQEGQCFEAFQTMRQKGIANLTAIVDRNGIQSDSDVADIKGIADIAATVRAMGLDATEIDGNDVQAAAKALGECRESRRPSVLVARTAKGAGISFMEAETTERRAYAWHGRAPDFREYLDALEELAGRLSTASVHDRLDHFLRDARSQAPATAQATAKPVASTGIAFGAELVQLASEREDLVVFDADLEKPCKLTGFAEAFPDRFVEMGISEQDMVSCAGGYALAGRLPIVNTYGSFFRRAYEQVYVNATERTKILYAGHYSGLCYEPDGKTHQCTGDLAMMRAIPGVAVLYPASDIEMARMLRWFVDECTGPAYMRLHRRPPDSRVDGNSPAELKPGWGTHVVDAQSKRAVLTSGPHMTAYCASAGRACGYDVYSIGWLRDLAAEFARELCDRYESLVVIEEHVDAGGLFDAVSLAIARARASSSLRSPAIFHKAVREFTFSTLEPYGLYRHFGLDDSALREYLGSLQA